MLPLHEGLAAIGAIGWEAVAYFSADGAFLCFWRGGAIGDLPWGQLGCWPGAGGSCWGFTLAPGRQGRQEEEGCCLPAGARSPVVGPFR